MWPSHIIAYIVSIVLILPFPYTHTIIVNYVIFLENYIRQTERNGGPRSLTFFARKKSFSFEKGDQCCITSRSIVSDIFLINQTRTLAAPVFILECADFGEASSDGDTVRPCVAAGPSGLNIKQTHHDQGNTTSKSIINETLLRSRKTAEKTDSQSWQRPKMTRTELTVHSLLFWFTNYE